MKTIGQLLLWIGFLGGAFVATYEVNGSQNLKLTIPAFVVSIVVLTIGIVMIYMGKSVSEQLATEDGNMDQLLESIRRLAGNAGELIQIQDELAPSQMVQTIDAKCADDFQEFADSRKAIIPLFGLTAYADVMTQFSAGERAMNRAWSAAADGYVDEVKDCLGRAQEHLNETRNLVEGLQKT